jgi:FkbM family methyltransferase
LTEVRVRAKVRQMPMGHARDKYTESYYLRHDVEGAALPYGAEEQDAFLRGVVRDHDARILDRVLFPGRRVLELGYGRGEAAKYAIEHGAGHYEGVDFSEAERRIAEKFLAGHGVGSAVLHTAEALDWVERRLVDHAVDEVEGFDVVLMLDFVEHVPRSELAELLTRLRALLSATALVVVNTPAFRVDNDVVAEGIDVRSDQDCVDSTDLNAATAGMHCNKYTVVSLQRFMSECGYRNISEAHFFIPDVEHDPLGPRRSYRAEWEEAGRQGRPVAGRYEDDEVELAYVPEHLPSWQQFDQGRLQGIELLVHDEYRAAAFCDGEYDRELFDDCGTLDLDGGTVCDVGGFIGVSALLFSRLVGPSGRVLTFEPNPWNVVRLQRNLARNDALGNGIEIYPLALSDVSGETAWTFSDSVDTGYSSTSRLDTAHAAIASSSLAALDFREGMTPVSTLDDVVEARRLVPDVVKIDVEGAEHLLLMGAVRTLTAHAPTLYIEVHSPFCGVACAHLLDGLGYQMEPLAVEHDGRVMLKATKGPAWAGDAAVDVARLKGRLLAAQQENAAERETSRLLRAEVRRTEARLQGLRADLATARRDRDIARHHWRDAARVADHPVVQALRALSRAARRTLRWGTPPRV